MSKTISRPASLFATWLQKPSDPVHAGLISSLFIEAKLLFRNYAILQATYHIVNECAVKKVTRGISR